MATHTLYGFAPGAIDVVRGSGHLTEGTIFQVNDNFNSATDGVKLVVTDDDTAFGGDPTRGERGDDTNQTGTATGPDGTLSGNFYLEDVRTLVTSSGDEVNLYRVETAGKLVGWFADGVLTPGDTCEITDYSNVTSDNHPDYADLEQTAANPTTGLLVSGTQSAESLVGQTVSETLSAAGGDDQIFGGGGGDVIYAGAGNDHVDGGIGADLVFGGSGDDTILGGASVSFSSPAINPFAISPPDLGANATHTDSMVVSDGVNDTNLTLNYRTGASGSLDALSGGDSAQTNDVLLLGGVSETEPAFEMRFDEPVGNLAFEINDIDSAGFDDEIRLEAYDADGNLVPIELTTRSSHHTVEQDGSTGVVELHGGQSTIETVGGADSDGGISINIPGPVAEVKLFHYDGPDSSTAGGVFLNNFNFGSIGAAGADLGDSLFGGTGDDTIFGGDGGDTIEGGADSDSLSGGDGNDTLRGDGDDSLAGNTAAQAEPVGGNLLANGSFEDISGTEASFFGQVAFDGSITGWTTTSATTDIELHDSGFRGVEGTDGDYWLDLEASPGNIRIGQDVQGLTDGETYRLEFEHNDTANQSNGIKIYWNGEVIDTVDPVNGTWTNASYDLVAGTGDGSNRLEFEGTGAENNEGASLDNVRLFATQPVPDPVDGNDSISGGAGDDLIFGDGGNDTLDGGEDSDSIAGGSGEDVLSGGSGNDTLEGGEGDDTLSGGDGEDVFVLTSAGGADFVDRFEMGRDRVDTSDLQDANGDEVTADEVVVTEVPGQPQVLIFPQGETLTVPQGTVDTTSPQSQFASLVTMGVPPCFAPGTMIRTPSGNRAVETLAPGDMVMTADRGARPLRWIGRREEYFETREDKHRPILIAAGSLGNHLPSRDLIVSPQHRMVLNWPAVQRSHGTGQVLALAKGLTDLPGVRIMRGKASIAYFALLFDRHEVIFAENAPTESFRPGPEAMKGFTPEIRRQIHAIYPGLHDDPERALGPPARPIVNRREANALVAKYLVEPVSRRLQDPHELRRWDLDADAERRTFADSLPDKAS
ncbi:MAG: Hint domain-containing protein [Paracoccaceae bacterium]